MTAIANAIINDALCHIHYTKSGFAALNAYEEGYDSGNIEERVKTFLGLKEHWWMQVYPRTAHAKIHQGLEGEELSYYQGIERAYQFACECLQQKPTIEFYDNMHRLAFPTYKISQWACNTFRVRFGGTAWSTTTILDLFKALPKTLFKETRKNSAKYAKGAVLELYHSQQTQHGKDKILEELQISEEELLADQNDHIAFAQKFRHQLDEKIESMNQYIAERSALLETHCSIARIQRVGIGTLRIDYKCRYPETTLGRLFREFSLEIVKVDSKDAKIRLIADLFQVLEWLQPFAEKQDELNQVLLSKLLTEHGFNPAILDKCGVAKYCTLDEFVDYLKIGVKKWQKETAKLTPI